MIDFEKMSPEAKFLFLALTKAALLMKELGKNKEDFVSFCKEIWKSMEMSDLQTLKSIIDGQMTKDIHSSIKSYINKHGMENER